VAVLGIEADKTLLVEKEEIDRLIGKMKVCVTGVP
jgi:hypothetical protein